MKSKLLSIILIVLTSSIVALGQEDPTKRNYNFQPGDVVCSTDGTLMGSLYISKANDDKVVGVFTGLNSNRRSEVVRSTGVTMVRISEENGIIERGDHLTVLDNGRAAKATGSGMMLGVALSEPKDGMVSVQLGIAYVSLKDNTK